MKYTKEQLQGMSDFEINKLLAELSYGLCNTQTDSLGNTYSEGLYSNGDLFYFSTDYCNNPSDIMPMAFENGISLKCVRCPAGSGFAYYAQSDGELWCTGYMPPLRAIACCLILVLQGKE